MDTCIIIQAVEPDAVYVLDADSGHPVRDTRGLEVDAFLITIFRHDLVLLYRITGVTRSSSSSSSGWHIPTTQNC